MDEFVQFCEMKYGPSDPRTIEAKSKLATFHSLLCKHEEVESGDVDERRLDYTRIGGSLMEVLGGGHPAKEKSVSMPPPPPRPAQTKKNVVAITHEAFYSIPCTATASLFSMNP